MSAAKRTAKRGRKALDSAPDWFGCGRRISAGSWRAFLRARSGFYAAKDKSASKA